mmetsp:Transcript_29123/g.67018  ORF Transcript_29123/g.67018 Transcript_29123/m.67018 type:complete len:343 (+) Transcript_29123:92-1120(+)
MSRHGKPVKVWPSLRLATFSWFCVLQRGLTVQLAAMPAKFLLVTSSTTGKIYYSVLPDDGGVVSSVSMNELVTDLSSPMGIAVDSSRRALFVADPVANAIYKYHLTGGGTSLGVGGRSTLVNGTEARWVAVDPSGDVFYTDEQQNRVYKLPLTNQTSAEILYDSDTVAEVSHPGGIAADSFHLYWTNKAQGTTAGSLVRAELDPDNSSAASSVEVLASNVDTAYGACLALSNVFYTVTDAAVYGLKRSGSGVQTISNRMHSPRGCAFDGEGTVYVADAGENAVYAFSGNMQELVGTGLAYIGAVEGAYDAAVFLSHASTRPSLLFVTLMVLSGMSRWQAVLR